MLMRTPYRARGVSFRWAECSVATGLLKSSPDFLSEKPVELSGRDEVLYFGLCQPVTLHRLCLTYYVGGSPSASE